MAKIKIIFEANPEKPGYSTVIWSIVTDNRKAGEFSTGLEVTDEQVAFLKRYRKGLTSFVKDAGLISLWQRIYGDTFIDESGKEQVGYLKKAIDLLPAMGPTFTIMDYGLMLKNYDKMAPKCLEDDVLLWLYNKEAALKETEQYGTAGSYRDTASSLKRYLKYAEWPQEKLPFKSVDKQFLQKYEIWMLKFGKAARGKNGVDSPASETTIGFYTRCIRSIFNDAKEEGLVSERLYPFGMKRYVTPVGDNTKKAMSETIIKGIMNMELKGAQQRSRDLWVLSYISGGINFSDLLRLRRRDINNAQDKFSYRRKKTKRTKKRSAMLVHGILTDLSWQIINRWGAKDTSPNAYIFPFISDAMDEAEKEAKTDYIIAITNKHMKDICSALKYSGNTSTYAARHSFATVMLHSEAPIGFISEQLGHGSIATTQNYLSSFSDDKSKKYLNALTFN